MATLKTVWAFKRLPALQNKIGFVSIDTATADSLIAAGDAQDPREGYRRLKYIESDAASRSNRKRRVRVSADMMAGAGDEKSRF